MWIFLINFLKIARLAHYMLRKQFLLACTLATVSFLSVYDVAGTDSEHNAIMRTGRDLRSGGAYAVANGYPAVGTVVSAKGELEAVKARSAATGNYVPAASDGQADLEYLLAQGRFALGFLPWGRFERAGEISGLIEELDGLAAYMAENQVSGEESREQLERMTGRIMESAAPDKFKILGYSLVCVLSVLYAAQSAASAFSRSRSRNTGEARKEAVAARSD